MTPEEIRQQAEKNVLAKYGSVNALKVYVEGEVNRLKEETRRRSHLTPEQIAASQELADRLENTIIDWIKQRNSNHNILEIFEALMSLLSGRLAFIDSMFEQWCLDKYRPLPPIK
jgi:hypothetical protein